MDESALGLGKELEATRNDTVYAGHPLIPECPLGTSDPDWMSAVATRDLVVIVRDRRIRTKPVERAQFRATSLRVFWIAGKRDQSTRQWLTRLERIGRQWSGPSLRVDRARGSSLSTKAAFARSSCSYGRQRLKGTLTQG